MWTLKHKWVWRTGPSPAGWLVVPGPPFEIGAPPFHVWPLGCYIHPILYFKNVALPSGFWPPLLLNPGDGPGEECWWQSANLENLSSSPMSRKVFITCDLYASNCSVKNFLFLKYCWICQVKSKVQTNDVWYSANFVSAINLSLKHNHKILFANISGLSFPARACKNSSAIAASI